MRIVEYIDTLRAGGKERQLVELLKGLTATPGIDCELIVMSDNIHYDDLYKLDLPIHLLLRKTDKDPGIFIRLYLLLREIRPDILHSWGSLCPVYALPAVKLLNIKFVNGFIRSSIPPSLFYKDKKWLRSKITFPFSDAIVANSKTGLKAYNVSGKKSYYIHNGFDFNRVTNLLTPEAVKTKYHISTDFIVGMVASFSDNKDFNLFVDAAELILKTREDVTFLAIGDGKNREACMRRVPKSLEQFIKFPGRVNDVEGLMQVMTAGVLISPQGEGISNSIMEFMASGKPVVASDCGGNRELIIDNETGYLVPNGDASAVAEKIKFFLDNPEQAVRFGLAGQQRLKDMFSLENFTQKYISLYNHLLT
ncbi:MAG: glycosyltransferase [Desulfobacterales bacterium]|nr:glycosyltransferase [Desulfobacterales bacterium]